MLLNKCKSSLPIESNRLAIISNIINSLCISVCARLSNKLMKASHTHTCEMWKFPFRFVDRQTLSGHSLCQCVRFRFNIFRPGQTEDPDQIQTMSTLSFQLSSRWMHTHTTLAAARCESDAKRVARNSSGKREKKKRILRGSRRQRKWNYNKLRQERPCVASTTNSNGIKINTTTHNNR